MTSQCPPPPASTLPKGVGIVYGIGAQKAGTSWLHAYLASHPESLTQPVKELHYFNVRHMESERFHMTNRFAWLKKNAHLLETDLSPARLNAIQRHAAHLRIFTDRPGDHRRYLDYLLHGRTAERLVCDITPAYCVLDAPAFREMDGLGDARFIFVMRDPVERFWSQVCMIVRSQSPDLASADFAIACAHLARRKIKEGVAALPRRSDYLRTITALEAAVPREHILYLFHQKEFSQSVCDRICDFLGIARHAQSPVDAKLRGRSAPLTPDLRGELGEYLRGQYAGVIAKFGDETPEAWHAFARKNGYTAADGQSHCA